LERSKEKHRRLLRRSVWAERGAWSAAWWNHPGRKKTPVAGDEKALGGTSGKTLLVLAIDGFGERNYRSGVEGVARGSLLSDRGFSFGRAKFGSAARALRD